LVGKNHAKRIARTAKEESTDWFQNDGRGRGGLWVKLPKKGKVQAKDTPKKAESKIVFRPGNLELKEKEQEKIKAAGVFRSRDHRAKGMTLIAKRKLGKELRSKRPGNFGVSVAPYGKEGKKPKGDPTHETEKEKKASLTQSLADGGKSTSQKAT